MMENWNSFSNNLFISITEGKVKKNYVVEQIKPALPTEMDRALEELYAEFAQTYGIPLSVNPISSTSKNN